MKKYRNEFSCVAEFEDGISEEAIKEKLSMMTGKWERIHENCDCATCQRSHK